MRIRSRPDQPLTCASFITDKGNYNRNHGPIPYLDARSHTIKVDGCVKKPLVLSVVDIQNKYTQHEITSVLQCAGNRRHTMRTLLKEVNGIDWGDAAVMNCRWKGAWLRDILKDAVVDVEKDQEAHVAFSCHETSVQHVDWYEVSVDLKRAMSEEADVLVALGMNGKPLPVHHGFPVRMIVPGVSGCRSVKWLNRITVQLEESKNYYQRYDYKRLPPEATDVEEAKKYWDKTPALQDMSINSVIAKPKTGDVVRLSQSGTVQVKGYAIPYSNHGPVTQVEVSADDGKTWKDATIIVGGSQEDKWCWALWNTEISLERSQGQRLLSRATDAGGNVQNAHPVWNLRGLGYDGYGEARDLTVL